MISRIPVAFIQGQGNFIILNDKMIKLFLTSNMRFDLCLLVLFVFVGGSGGLSYGRE